MSIEKNKEIVRRYQEICNRNDLDALGEVVAEDVITPKIVPGFPSGLEGAKAVHRLAIAGMTSFHTEIQNLIAEEDKVVVRVVITGIHTGEFFGTPATGKHVEFTGIYIARNANGRIVEHWGEEDSVSLLQQLGVLKL